MLWCHHCHIALGDLARYSAADISGDDAAAELVQADLRRAKLHYEASRKGGVKY